MIVVKIIVIALHTILRTSCCGFKIFLYINRIFPELWRWNLGSSNYESPCSYAYSSCYASIFITLE